MNTLRLPPLQSLLGRIGLRTAAAGFGLTPAWLIALGAGGARQCWRIHQHWNGARRLEAAEPPATQACIAIIAANLPLRRKLQRFPDTARARQALLRAAAAEFPLPADAIDCGLGLRGDEGYLYALPRATRAQWQAENPPLQALLVAPDADLSPAACLATLEQFERYGPTLSLGGAPRYLPRRQLMQGALGALLVLLLTGLGLLALQPRWLDQLLDAEITALEQQVGELPRINAASERMAHAAAAAAQLAADPAARLPADLAQLFATLPAGHGIRRAEFKAGTLQIAGSGPDPGPWLRAAGFTDDGITLEKLGSVPTWRAAKKL